MKDKLSVASGNALGSALCAMGTFDRVVCDHVRVQSVHAGRVDCLLTVTPDLCNAYGTLHGGAIATLVDHCGTLALMSLKPLSPGVSLDISCQYLSAAKVGEHLLISSVALKNGTTISLADVTIRMASEDGSGKIVAVGKHTKFVK
jgi:acyl-coenzyme A thioesterase 13